MLSPDQIALCDGVIAAVKANVAHGIAKETELLLNTQRDLIARVESQAQRISALSKALAAVERKMQEK